jgi:sulfoxide reductase heme-binding subunit YedZ
MAKPLVFTLCLWPLAALIYGAFTDGLGANPAERLIRSTGDWSLRFLCITLAITPLRVSLKQAALARFRRMLGLFTYFYALCHLLAYGWLDMGLYLEEIAKDILKRPFILVGFGAWLLLTPLALTSFNAAIRRLGAQRWRRLHQVVYLVAGLALLHFFWMRSGKRDYAEVLVYAAIMAVLLLWRVWHTWRERVRKSQPTP